MILSLFILTALMGIWSLYNAIQQHRKFMVWLERDLALRQAFRDHLVRGDIEGAREIRTAALDNLNRFP